MLRNAGLYWFHDVPAQASPSPRPRSLLAPTHGHPILPTEIQGKLKSLSWSLGRCVNREQTEEGIIEESLMEGWSPRYGREKRGQQGMARHLG